METNLLIVTERVCPHHHRSAIFLTCYALTFQIQGAPRPLRAKAAVSAAAAVVMALPIARRSEKMGEKAAIAALLPATVSVKAGRKFEATRAKAVSTGAMRVSEEEVERRTARRERVLTMGGVTGETKVTTRSGMERRSSTSPRRSGAMTRVPQPAKIARK